MRIVRRVINESEEPSTVYGIDSCYRKTPSNYKPIIKMIEKATNGFDESMFSNWDEDKLRDAILMIKSPQDYRMINKQLICFATSQAHDPTIGLDPIISRDLIRFYIKKSFGSETSYISSESNNKNIIMRKLKSLGI
jgi:hypothetical protein